MRPRDGINRLKNLYLILVAVGFSVMAVLAFAEKYMPVQLFKILLYGSVSLFLIGNILLYIGIRCPKCKAIIGISHRVFRRESQSVPSLQIQF